MHSRWSVASNLFRRVQTHKHSQVAALNREVFWCIFPMGRECSWSPAGVATVQPSSPQPAGSPVWMTSLSRWSEYHFSPQRGSVGLKGGASTVNNPSSVGQTTPRCSVGGLRLWLSERNLKFALFFLFFFCEHRLEIIPKARRRETCSAAVTVTEVFSWGRGGGAPAAGHSVLGCGCSRGGRSGSGGPRVERGRGNSDALGEGKMHNALRYRDNKNERCSFYSFKGKYPTSNLTTFIFLMSPDLLF